VECQLAEPVDRHKSGREERPFLPAAFSALLVVGLAACQTGDDGAQSYPSLHTVPDESRPSLPVEERRQIVRELVEERDRSRQNTTIVRQRSGLGDNMTDVLPGDDILAEDVIPETAETGDNSFQLRSESGSRAGTVFRQESDADDGSLDDFIRQLKRDTTPSTPTEDSGLEEEDEDRTSFLIPNIVAPNIVIPVRHGEQIDHVRLAAFVPATVPDLPIRLDTHVLLVADEEEPGVFCRYFGWSVAWSSICVAGENAMASNETEEDVSADLEENERRLEGGPPLLEADDQENEAADTEDDTSSGETRRDRAERRLSEDDAAQAIEDAGRSALAPVTSSLGKLRDFLRARRTASDIPVSREGGSSLSDVPSAEASVDRPPLPSKRPEQRRDLMIVDGREQFDFSRTPVPAFKPTPDEPVILPPLMSREDRSPVIARADPPQIPRVRPQDLLAERETADRNSVPEERGEADDLSAAFAGPETTPSETAVTPEISDLASRLPQAPPPIELETASQAPAAASETPDQPLDAATLSELAEPTVGSAREVTAMIIAFEPDTQSLPGNVQVDLANMLADARARNLKVYVIGEATTNHLAKRRATDVGAKLVQLGATAELLEYDHRAIADVDQVRLVLRPAGSDSHTAESEPLRLDQ